MNKYDAQKYKLAGETLDAFFHQFGDFDEYNRVMLTVLFEVLYGKPDVPLPGEERQRRDQDNNNSSD